MTVNQHVKFKTNLKAYPAMAALEMFRLCPSSSPDNDSRIKFIRPDPREMTKLDTKAIYFLERFETTLEADSSRNIATAAEIALEDANKTYPNIRSDKSQTAYLHMAEFYMAYVEIGLTKSLRPDEVKRLLNRVYQLKPSHKAIQVKIRNDSYDPGILSTIIVPSDISENDIRQTLRNALIETKFNIQDAIEHTLKNNPSWERVSNSPDISINLTELR